MTRLTDPHGFLSVGALPPPDLRRCKCPRCCCPHCGVRYRRITPHLQIAQHERRVALRDIIGQLTDLLWFTGAIKAPLQLRGAVPVELVDFFDSLIVKQLGRGR